MEDKNWGEGSSRSSRRSSLPASLRQHLVSAPASSTSRSSSYEGHQFETASLSEDATPTSLDPENLLTLPAFPTLASSSGLGASSPPSPQQQQQPSLLHTPSLTLAPPAFEEHTIRSTSQNISASSSSTGDLQAENTRRFVASSSPSFDTHNRPNPIPPAPPPPPLHGYGYSTFTSPSPYTFPPPAPPHTAWAEPIHWQEADRTAQLYYSSFNNWAPRDLRSSGQFPSASGSRAPTYPPGHSPTQEWATSASPASPSSSVSISGQPSSFPRNVVPAHQPPYADLGDQRAYGMIFVWFFAISSWSELRGH